MELLLTIIHLLACFVLILVVLIQKGKGADLAGAFGGGGSQSNIGVRSATQLIHKMTIGAAVFFMITSYSLGLTGSAQPSIAAEAERQAQTATEENGAATADETQQQPAEEPAVDEGTDQQAPGSEDQSSEQQQDDTTQN